MDNDSEEGSLPKFKKDSNQSSFSKVTPKNSQPDGLFSSAPEPTSDSNVNTSCSKPLTPPNGSWKCERNEKECSLLCDRGFMAKRPVVIK